MDTYTIENSLQLSIRRDNLVAADTSLARTIVAALLADPEPKAAGHSFPPFRELWVSFTPEGAEINGLPSEVDSEGFSQRWVNGRALISPSERFLQDFQDSFQTVLQPLFETTGSVSKQDAVLIRILLF